MQPVELAVISTAVLVQAELVAMRACGLSVWRIVRSVLQTGLLMLIVAVIIGGTFGSYLGANRFSAQTVEKMLGIVVLLAIGFLIKKLITI